MARGVPTLFDTDCSWFSLAKELFHEINNVPSFSFQWDLWEKIGFKATEQTAKG